MFLTQHLIRRNKRVFLEIKLNHYIRTVAAALLNPSKSDVFHTGFCSPRLQVHMSYFHFAFCYYSRWFWCLSPGSWWSWHSLPRNFDRSRKTRSCNLSFVRRVNTACALQLYVTEIRGGFHINLSGRKIGLRVLLHTYTLRCINRSRTSRIHLPSTAKIPLLCVMSENQWL